MKTNLDKTFKTDGKLEKDGVWMWLDADETTGFLVRTFKSTNPRVKAAMAKHYKPYARLIDIGTLEPEKEREIQIKLFVEVSMVDWKGVEVDGVDTKYSATIAIELFKGLPELFDTLLKYSQDSNNYKEDLGNSSSAT